MIILKVIKNGQGLRVGEKYLGTQDEFMGYGTAYKLKNTQSYYLNTLLEPVRVSVLNSTLEPVAQVKVKVLSGERIKVGSRIIEKYTLTQMKKDGNVYLYSLKNNSRIRIEDILEALKGVE